MSELIEQIKQALEAATPGPWEYQAGYYGRNHLVSQVETGNVVCMGKTFEKTESDFHLIANAPTWLSQLLQEREHMVEALKLICNSTMSVYQDIDHMAADFKLMAYEALKQVGELDD